MGKVTFTDPLSRRVSWLQTKDEIAKKQREWAFEDLSNLIALCAEYKIEFNDDLGKTWYCLALALARKYHPKPKKRGVEKKWNPLNEGALVVEVDRLIEEKGSGASVRWACGRLSKEEPWRSFLDGSGTEKLSQNPAEVLRRKYQEVYSQSSIQLSQFAYRMYTKDGDLQDWKEYLATVVRKIEKN